MWQLYHQNTQNLSFFFHPHCHWSSFYHHLLYQLLHQLPNCFLIIVTISPVRRNGQPQQTSLINIPTGIHSVFSVGSLWKWLKGASWPGPFLGHTELPQKNCKMLFLSWSLNMLIPLNRRFYASICFIWLTLPHPFWSI